MRERVRDRVRERVRDRVRESVRDRVRERVRDRVRERVKVRVRSRVRQRVRDTPDARTRGGETEGELRGAEHVSARRARSLCRGGLILMWRACEGGDEWAEGRLAESGTPIRERQHSKWISLTRGLGERGEGWRDGGRERGEGWREGGRE